MIYNPREGSLDLQDTTLNYFTFGRGTKPLVLIQGLNTRGIHGFAFFIAHAYRLFAKDYKVYLFDRRAKVDKGLTVSDLALDIEVAMDMLEISKADVIGVSQGGMIAQYMAIHRPDLVNRLVLAVTLSRNNPVLEEAIQTWIQYTQQGDIKNLVRDMMMRVYSEQYVNRYKSLIPLLAKLQQPKDKERFIILSESCLTCDTYEQLEKIKCPVFVIGGQLDKVVTGQASYEIAEKLDCRIYMYQDLGHAAYHEAKDFNLRILNFLMA